MRQMRFRALLALVLALAALFAHTGAAAQEQTAVMTLMVYITGSDLESVGGAATLDIIEMIRSGVDTERVNVMLCTGGTKQWQSEFPNDQVCIYRVDGVRPVLETQLGAVSMGAADTLGGFLRYSAERYPAGQYALILWDHGGGPMNGMCYDELFMNDQSRDTLDLGELKAALESSPFDASNPLEWIGFDCCLMSSVETAYTCAPFARYMIASQETEPGTGWNYGFLEHASEGLSGAEIGSLVIAGYTERADSTGAMLTMACTDLSKLGQVEDAMNRLFENLDGMLSPERFQIVSNGRRDAKSLGRASTGSEYDLVDLYSLAEQYALIAPEQASALQSALAAAVVENGGNQPDSHGLSIYYPYYNKDYYKALWGSLYQQWGFAEQYRRFVEDYAEVWLGGQLADWSGMRAAALPPLPEGQEVTLPLTPEQAENFAYAQLYVISDMAYANDCFYKLDEVDDVTLDGDGVLHAHYNYKALYVTDEDGEAQCVVPYTVVDGYYLIRANLSDETYRDYTARAYSTRFEDEEVEAALNVRKVFLQCLPNAAGDGLDVVGVIDLGAGTQGMLAEYEPLNTGKQLISAGMEDWRWLWFFRFPRAPKQDGAGNYLPFDAWEYPEDRIINEWDYVDNSRPWALKFIEGKLTGQALYAQYIVHDTQGNRTGSDLIALEDEGLIPVAALDETAYASERVTLTATGVDISEAALDKGLILRFDRVDASREQLDDLFLWADRVLLNRCMLTRRDFILTSMPGADGHTVYALKIPERAMPAMLEERLDRIRIDFSWYDRTGEAPEVEAFSCELECAVDIGSIHDREDAPAVLARARAGDVDYQLLGMTEETDWLTLTLRVENLGAEVLDHGWRESALIDGCAWEKVVDYGVFDLPADCWTVHSLRVFDRGDVLKLNGTDVYSLNVNNLDRWGTEAIHAMEFADSNDDVIRFELETPFALASAGEAGTTLPARQTAVSLLDTETMAIDLRNVALEEGALRLTLDIANRSSEAYDVNTWFCRVDGTPTRFNVNDADGSHMNILDDRSVTVPAGHRRRFVFLAEQGEGEPALAGAETIEMGITAKAESEALAGLIILPKLGIDAGRLWTDLGGSVMPLDGVTALTEAEQPENLPRDPLSIADVTWKADGAVARDGVTLRIPLTAEQARSARKAGVNLVAPTEHGMQLVAKLFGPLSLTEDAMLECAFSGLLLCVDGADWPSPQGISGSAEEGWLYHLYNLDIYTETWHLDLSDHDQTFGIYAHVDPEERRARVQEVEAGYAFGTGERIYRLEYLSSKYDDEDGRIVGETGGFMGERIEIEANVIHLEVRDAADFEPIVVAEIVDEDGNEYCVQSTWREATAY